MTGKTAVFVHAHHPEKADWSEVVLGRAPSQMGRVTAAIRFAMDIDASAVVFSRMLANGTVEPGFRLAEEGSAVLKRFDAFADQDPAQVDAFVRDRCVVIDGRTSDNTWGEAIAFRRFLQSGGYTRAFCVSSPDHLPRCLRDLQMATSDLDGLLSLGAVASDVSVTEEAPAVLEAPHRPDRSPAPLNRIGNRLAQLSGDRQMAASEEIAAVLARYEDAGRNAA